MSTDPECKVCGGKRFSLSEDGKRSQCECVLQRKARVYLRKLSPMTSVPDLLPSLDQADPQKNLLIKAPFGIKPLQMKWIFAYLLLKRGVRRTYDLLNAYDVVLTKFGEHEDFKTIFKISSEVLCLYCGFNEVKNAMMGEIVVSLLDLREVKGLTNWVLVRGSPLFAPQIEEYTRGRDYQVLLLPGVSASPSSSTASSTTTSPTSVTKVRESHLK